ncbi:hypothetical protein WICPIJ_005813 [Wickerhamomyces pijperi]|uniref:Uncharacterized protein n=1 Tax=Wickerhamomyces pijperi TaxID=599730 RepID=A0A9P8Q562_WICPI|nr:hypothetical protein WICPIJ_005813 [Wickerhamomyces pijperi]
MEYHNKIDINIEDLRKVKQQFIKNASNKIDTYLPEQDNTDSMKAQVVLAVQDFIDRILESSRSSLDINGLLPDEPLKEAMDTISTDSEPFDHLLQKQVRELYREVEEETLKLAQLRRRKPQELRDQYKDSFLSSMSDLESLKKQIESITDQNVDYDEMESKKSAYEKEMMTRIDDIIEEYTSSLQTIQNIKKVSPKSYFLHNVKILKY